MSMIPAWVDGELSPFDKLEVHLKGIRHKAVSVFVIRGQEMLLQRRALGKYHTPGLWANTCCTHPDWDEAPRECAIRRLDQELGIRGLDPEFRHNLEYRADVGGGMTEHEVVDVFVASVNSALPMSPNAEEVMDVRWVPYSDLLSELGDTPEKFTPWLRIYLSDYADKIFGTDLDQRRSA